MPLAFSQLDSLALRVSIASLFAVCATINQVTAQVREGYAVTEDSVRLWYRIVGKGKETVLVPVGLYYGTRLDRLARGRRIVLYDPRGRGHSDSVAPAKVSLDNQIRDIETIRRAVGAQRAAVSRSRLAPSPTCRA